MDKGQNKKLESLYRKNYSRIYKYALQMTKNPALSQDITQEVFLRVTQKQEKILNHDNPTGFLYKTARNVTLESQRQLIRNRHDELDEETVADDIFDCLDILERERDCTIDEKMYIENVLSLLPKDKRFLYEEHFVNGKTIRQIALEQGVDEASLRMKFTRIRRELTELVSQIDFEN